MRRDKKTPPIRNPHTDTSDRSFAFRRSRTITGSAATSVRAAGEDRGQLQSPRLQEHSLRKHRRILLIYLALALVLSALLGYVVSSYVGGISQVNTKTAQPINKPIDQSRYEAITANYFKDHPFERFLFALDEDAMNRYITFHAPEVVVASLSKADSIGSGELTLQLREPVVSWTIQEQQYFVDKEGISYTMNYFSTPTILVSDKSGVSAEAGLIASTKLLRFIGRVITLVNESQTSPVESVVLPASSTRQVDFKLVDRPYVIKANLDRDPAGQAADIINAVKYVESKQLTPAYLDVRVESKAYYKDA